MRVKPITGQPDAEDGNKKPRAISKFPSSGTHCGFTHGDAIRPRNQQSVVRGIFLMGAVVVGIGAIIRTWAGAYIRANVLQDWNVRTEKLVADGPFRYTRNPLYLGILIGVFGAGVMCSPVGWAVQVLLAIVFVCRLILREESELLRTQKESFRAYCRAVPRLLPSFEPRISASGARPHWREGFAVQLNWWGIAMANVTRAISLRPWMAFSVGGRGSHHVSISKACLEDVLPASRDGQKCPLGPPCF